MTVSEVLQKAVKDHCLPISQIRLLLSHALSLSVEELLRDPHQKLGRPSIDAFFSLCNRLQQGEPLSRIVGQREFWSLNFKLSSATLDPRPDSETLIEAVLKLLPDQNRSFDLVDLGTGTGCLLISLLTEYKNAKGIGVDISDEALAIARNNAEINNVERRANFLESHWFKELQDRFDLIVSNPPYIADKVYNTLDQNVRDYDPKVALVGGEAGLDCYRIIIKDAPNYLNRDGIIIFEIGYDQAEDVQNLLEQAGFKGIHVFQDLEGRDRCIAAQKG
jgi:release factor glutamine methyltransferase